MIARRLDAVCMIALLSMAPSMGEAQAQPLRAGDRVQITTPIFTASGVIAPLAVDPDTLRLTRRGQANQLLVPWSSISVLSVSQPRTRREGLLRGAKWRLLIGAAVGAISLATPTPEGEDYDEGTLALEAVLDFTIVGAAYGAIRPGGRWQRVSVAATRESVRLALAQPRPAEQALAAIREATPSTRAGETPAVELTAGFSAPRSRYAQFPGLAVALAINAGWKPTQGVSLVADAHVALFASGILGGPRVYVRSAPLFSRRRVVTSFAQFLAGSVPAERAGVVESTGGRALQPGAGIEYGSGSKAYRLQVDYTLVRNGFVDDDRTPGQHVEKLTGTRVLFGVTWRSQDWRAR